MTLTELRYVVALARERHFGHAAEACFVSQPTLSVAIRKLEEELGVLLFERNKGDVVTTPIGERVVEQAQRVLEEAEAVHGVAREGRDQLKGELRLGAIFTIGPYLLPHLVPILHEQAPQMPLVLEENYTVRLARRLKQGELDVIIIALPFEEPGIVTTPVYEEPFVTVLPASHPLRERERISADDLASETVLLLGPGHCFRDQVLEVCPACGISGRDDHLARAVEGSSLETIRHMVASGIGITVLPCTAVTAERYAQRLLEIRRFEAPVPGRRVALAWRRSFPRPRAVEAVRQAILASGLSCVDYIDAPIETARRIN